MATHWGTFNKGTTLSACHSIAVNALTAEGFSQVNTAADGPQFLLGVSGAVVVSVFLDPISSVNIRVTVAAHSDDSVAAESGRNRVRTRLANG